VIVSENNGFAVGRRFQNIVDARSKTATYVSNVAVSVQGTQQAYGINDNYLIFSVFHLIFNNMRIPYRGKIGKQFFYGNNMFFVCLVRSND